MGTKKEFLHALDQVQELYPNMVVLSRLSKLLKNPNSDLEDLAKLIRTEPALTLDVMRVCNSPFYSRGEKCRDIQTAVSLVGYNEVQRVVGLILARDVCSRDLKKYGTTAQEFWAESLTVAVLMEGMAKAFGMDPSEAGTVGLLHAIGKVVINNILEDFEIDIYWDPILPVEDWERMMVGFNYAEAGARLLKRWEFPSEIINAVGLHLKPKEAPTRIPMLELLHFSVRLFGAVGAGCAKSNYNVPIYPPVTDRLDKSRTRRIVDEAKEAFRRNTEAVFHS